MSTEQTKDTREVQTPTIDQHTTDNAGFNVIDLNQSTEEKSQQNSKEEPLFFWSEPGVCG